MQELRVWWIPNPPRKPFYFPVISVMEGIRIYSALMKYDLYLGKLITDNAGGLEVKEQFGKWEEYYNEDGDDISEIVKNNKGGIKNA